MFDNPKRIALPAGYVGKPASIEQKPTDPFAGLEALSGLQSSDPLTREIGYRAEQMRRQSLAATVILPSHVEMLKNRTFRPPHLNGMLNAVSAARSLGGSPLILTTACGTITYEFSPGGVPAQYLLVGGLTPKDAERLSFLSATNFAAASNNETLEALLVAESGSVVIDLGAGTNAARIGMLKELCRKRGASFVAQDVVPQLARQAQVRTATPYIVVPPYQQFLGPVFSPGRPVTLTMNDVLSSMQADSMHQLMAACQGSNVQQLLATQTLGVADAADFWGRLSPYSEEVRIDLMGRRKEFCKTFADIHPAVVCAAIEEQARHAMYGFANCIVAANLSAAAEIRSDFKGIRILLDSTHLSIRNPDAVKYLRSFATGEAASLEKGLMAGEFNTVIIGPFGRGIRLEQHLDRPSGMCSLISTRYHIELRKEEILPGTSESLAELGLSEVGIPNLFAGISSAAVTEAEVRHAMRMQGIPGEIIDSGILRLGPKLANVLSVGTEFASEKMFTEIGEQRKSPFFVPYRGFSQALRAHAHESVVRDVGRA